MDIIYLMKKAMFRRNYSHKTIVSYVQCVKQFLQFCKKDFKYVKKKDIQDYLDHLVDKKLSGNTLNVHIHALKYVFEEILRKRVTWRIRYAKTPKKLPVFLTKEEIIRLFDAVKNPKYKLLLELIYSAGLRVGEAVKLKKEDLEIDRNIGWVREGKGRKDRPFIIAEIIKLKLKNHIENSNSDYVFPGNKLCHVSIRTVQEIIKKAAKDAKISKNIHPHTLRHSFATHLIENGYDIAAIQPLLGHTRADTTLVYVHLASPKMFKIRSPYDDL